MIVCARHAKTKRPRLWFLENVCILRSVVAIQKMWRSFNVRNRLAIAGPGVLKRALCNNDEEITMCIDKTRQHPYDYFSILEDGNVWWFDQRSIIQWAHKGHIVTNPYTRKPFQRGDLRRLRELIYIRAKYNLGVYHSSVSNPQTLVERRDLRWLRISQVLQETGIEIHPEHFIAMSQGHMGAFLNFFREDIRWWSAQVESGRRKKYYIWLTTFRQWSYTDDTQMSSDLAGIILGILMDFKECEQISQMISDAHSRSELLWI